MTDETVEIGERNYSSMDKMMNVAEDMFLNVPNRCIYPSIYLFIYLFACLSICLSICLLF